MTRLTIICHAATKATGEARFPGDDDQPMLDHVARWADSGERVKAGRWLAGPERRTTATAAALCGTGGVTTDPGLRDWNVGRWRGWNFADLHEAEPDALAEWMSNPAAEPHGGESLLALLSRVGRWLDHVSADRRRTAAVTHPAVLRAALVLALDADPRVFWRIAAQPLSLAHLTHDGRRWMLHSLVSPEQPSASDF